MQYKFDKPVHGTIGNEKYQCTIEWRNGKFIADEPVKTETYTGYMPTNKIIMG